MVHQDENMVIENMASQIISSDCSESDAYLQDSLLNKNGLDLHTGLSSAYFSKPSEDQWMEENLETEEKQESSVTTQSEDNDVNVTVLQSKNSDGNKRVYDCPVCHKRFGAPSKLKRHGLIHTNQRPFQCSICCRAFRERSHLKVHMKIHNVPVKRRTPSLQSYRDNRVSCNRASKSKLKPSPKYLTAHNDTTSTNKQKSTVQQDQNVLAEDMLSQNMSGGCSDSSVYLSKSTSPLENVENKVVFWCNNKSAWGLTHKTDILLDGKKASDIVPFGRMSDCPPKTDSSLRHCAPESRTEEKWAHHMDDIEDCVFVDSDTVVTQCVPDSYEPSSCQYQQKPDDPRLPEVVVELEDIEDPGECFIKPPHDLPLCPDCSQSFRTIRNLYAHNCTNRYPEGEMKKFHQCDICFKFFNAPSKLKRHYVTHTGQRPFQCTQCQKSFTQSHHLKTHMLSHR
ncbi:zinc finger protein 770-like [Sinocyclocheilus rhinocerous]|uniref:zinc finger protein 770-like n=1 Tax=Sinocyclocheilus rhinocerous TaxID=307959 RepID=UPI0007B81F0F|nr:PREDICTED: zinc finger protein 770-like [Sinocyclocheilus rhinocerous]